jgi:hypothetical protein
VNTLPTKLLEGLETSSRTSNKQYKICNDFTVLVKEEMVLQSMIYRLIEHGRHSGMEMTVEENYYYYYYYYYYMEQSPCREANRSSATQETLHFMEPEGSLLHPQEPTTCSYCGRKLGNDNPKTAISSTDYD